MKMTANIGMVIKRGSMAKKKQTGLKVKASGGSASVNLSEEQVLEIIREYVIRGTKQKDLAERYGVSQSRISRVLHGHVEPNRYTFDPAGDGKQRTANDLLFEGLKLAISMRKQVEKELAELKQERGFEKKLTEKTKQLKLARNEIDRLRKRVKALEDRLHRTKENNRR